MFHIMNADLLFLLCIEDMDRLGFYLNNLTDQAIRLDGFTVPIQRIYGHPFLVWGPDSISYLTEPELRQLHRRFGHPAVDRLTKILERAGHDDPSHRFLIRQITKFCHYCQKHAKAPARYKFKLENNLYFNFSIIVNIIYISGLFILYIINKAISF